MGVDIIPYCARSYGHGVVVLVIHNIFYLAQVDCDAIFYSCSAGKMNVASTSDEGQLRMTTSFYVRIGAYRTAN